jgi:hypothetical protein
MPVKPNAPPSPKAAIEKLLSSLDFTAESLVNSAIEQARLFEQSATYRVAKMRERSAAKMRLEQISAERELSIRSAAAAVGDKPTEGHIKAKLVLDPKVSLAQEEFNEADAYEEHSKLLVEAFRHRRDMIKSVGDLTRTEQSMEHIVEENQRKLQQTREKLRKKFPGSAS